MKKNENPLSSLESLDERLQIFAYIFILSNKLQMTMDKNIKEITSKQWFLLASLEYFEDAPTLKEIANRVNYSHQNTRQLLNKLEEKGFIKTVQDENDKRASRVLLTKKSKEWQEDNRDIQIDFLNEMYKNLEISELKSAAKTMIKLFKNLEDLKNEE